MALLRPMLVQHVQRAIRDNIDAALPDDLRGKLDYYYAAVAAIQAVDLFALSSAGPNDPTEPGWINTETYEPPVHLYGNFVPKVTGS